MRYEKKQELSVALDSLWMATSKYGRGDVVPWAEIESHVGPRRKHPGPYLIAKWRRRLLRERKIVTLTMVNVGVRLLTNKETANEIPTFRGRRAYRQVNRMIRETGTVNTSNLSLAERKMLADQTYSARQTRLMLGRAVRAQHKAVTATEGRPTPPKPKET